MIFPRRIITIFMSIACVFIAGCLPKTPVSDSEKTDWLYLKATDLQNDEAYDGATAEFKQFVAKFPQSDDANNVFARSAQERIDALTQRDALRTDLNTRPHTQRDNAQYQIATVYFNHRDDDTAMREFEKVYIDYPESELSDEAMRMRGECYWQKARGKPVNAILCAQQRALDISKFQIIP